MSSQYGNWKNASLGARVVSITAAPTEIRKTFRHDYINTPIHGKLKQFHVQRRKAFRNLRELIPLLSTHPMSLGRVRYDLETVYLRQISPEQHTYIPQEFIDKKWLDRPLYAEDKEALARSIIITDARGRRYQWPNIRKSLLYSDFSVTDGRGKDGRRYSIIE